MSILEGRLRLDDLETARDRIGLDMYRGEMLRRELPGKSKRGRPKSWFMDAARHLRGWV